MFPEVECISLKKNFNTNEEKSIIHGRMADFVKKKKFTTEKEVGEEILVFVISMAILKDSIRRCFLQPTTHSLGYLDDWWI